MRFRFEAIAFHLAYDALLLKIKLLTHQKLSYVLID